VLFLLCSIFAVAVAVVGIYGICLSVCHSRGYWHLNVLVLILPHTLQLCVLLLSFLLVFLLLRFVGICVNKIT